MAVPLRASTGELVTELPTQHVKTLNPHLDHAAFDALYTTEHTAGARGESKLGVSFSCPQEVYKYAQGHCQATVPL